jgi:hypothetical protein
MTVSYNRFQIANFNNQRLRKGTSDFEVHLGYVCVSDGQEVSPAVAKFFKADVAQIQCWDCQQQNVPIPAEDELKGILPIKTPEKLTRQ